MSSWLFHAQYTFIPGSHLKFLNSIAVHFYYNLQSFVLVLFDNLFMQFIIFLTQCIIFLMQLVISWHNWPLTWCSWLLFHGFVILDTNCTEYFSVKHLFVATITSGAFSPMSPCSLHKSLWCISSGIQIAVLGQTEYQPSYPRTHCMEQQVLQGFPLHWIGAILHSQHVHSSLWVAPACGMAMTTLTRWDTFATGFLWIVTFFLLEAGTVEE